MEHPVVQAFRDGVEEGTKLGLKFAADIVEKSCRHWFYCHCKKIAKILREGEVSTSTSVERPSESEPKWDDVIDEL